MEKLIIKINRLGAITDSIIELKPFMLFTGPSGLGKSYSSFLVHYMYLFMIGANRFERFFIERGWSYDKIMEKKPTPGVLFTIVKEDLLGWLNKDASDYIKYVTGNADAHVDVNIEIPSLLNELSFIFDEEMIGLHNKEDYFVRLSLNGIVYRLPVVSNQWGGIPFLTLLSSEIQRSILGIDKRISCTFLMPPSRGALTGALGLSDRIAASSGMYEEYIDDLKMLYSPDRATQGNIMRRIQSVNDGDIVLENDQWIYNLGDDGFIPLVAAASSIRELAPLALFVKKYKINESSILFEEPEAHLHPLKQILTADIITEMVMLGASMQVTTHSDYFIRRLNDWILLYKIKQQSEERHRIVCEKLGFDPSLILDPSIINSYLLKKRDNGTVEIINQDISDGIPYDTFHNVINEFINKSYMLELELNK